MKDKKLITYAEVEERLKNKNLKDYTSQDIFDKFIRLSEPMKTTKIQRYKSY